MADRCDSCGDDGPDLEVVHRVYLELDERNQVVGHRLADELETWCAVSRVTYPFQPVEADDAS